MGKRMRLPLNEPDGTYKMPGKISVPLNWTTYEGGRHMTTSSAPFYVDCCAVIPSAT
jgi:hypothetical protein